MQFLILKNSLDNRTISINFDNELVWNLRYESTDISIFSFCNNKYNNIP